MPDVENDRSKTLQIITWFLFVVAVFSVCARLGTKYVTTRSLGRDDRLVIAAQVRRTRFHAFEMSNNSIAKGHFTCSVYFHLYGSITWPWDNWSYPFPGLDQFYPQGLGVPS